MGVAAYACADLTIPALLDSALCVQMPMNKQPASQYASLIGVLSSKSAYLPVCLKYCEGIPCGSNWFPKSELQSLGSNIAIRLAIPPLERS